MMLKAFAKGWNPQKSTFLEFFGLSFEPKTNLQTYVLRLKAWKKTILNISVEKEKKLKM